jgi:hypothetical protein
MAVQKDRGIGLALAGAAVALLAGLAIAWALVARHRGESSAPPPASQAGLVINPADQAASRATPTKALRCFVAGQFVGNLPLADCAKRNGVATDALDVGLDQSGALAAADQASPAVTPLPPSAPKPVEAAPAEVAPAVPLPQVVNAGSGACWRYADGQWRKLPNDLSLPACTQALFAGRCERAGEAAYGRWAQQTLRLAPGRVEISPDNHNFHLLAEQPGCPPATAG